MYSIFADIASALLLLLQLYKYADVTRRVGKIHLMWLYLNSVSTFKVQVFEPVLASCKFETHWQVCSLQRQVASFIGWFKELAGGFTSTSSCFIT